MRIHVFQHVPFEGPGLIEVWGEQRGHTFSFTKLFESDCVFPDTAAFDMLVVMGGPMGVYDEQTYPWLIAEKQFIQNAIADRRPVLGICLGAQLIASALGAEVASNSQKEIGWYPVTLKKGVGARPIAKDVPESFTVLHWHGDRFELPQGALHLAESQACDNQGFLYQDHVLALQFHLEIEAKGLQALTEACAGELTESPFVQSADDMLHLAQQHDTRTLLNTLLDNWLALQP